MNNTAPAPGRERRVFEWRIGLLVLVCVPLFVGLGFWQLERAEQKQDILARFDAARQQPPVDLASLPQPAAALAYRPVRLEGEMLRGRDFLLDNRMRQGRYGVEVISPLRDAAGRLVLINRGWLEADPTRQVLPRVPPMESPVSLYGHVHVPPGESYVLGDLSSDSAWPRLVQAVDVAAFGDMLGEATYPFVVRLAPDSAGALLVDWPLINAGPEKHTGYAVQWFAMALVLLLLFLFRHTGLYERIRPRRSRGQLDQ